MKIFTTTSIKQLDADTIKNEPIASIDLMERASRALARAIAERCGWIGDIMDKGQVGQFLEINGIPAEDTEGITEQPFFVL